MKVDIDKIRGWFISKAVLVYDGATPIAIRPDAVEMILGPSVEYHCKRTRPDMSRVYSNIDHVDKNLFSHCDEIATVDVRFKSGRHHTFTHMNNRLRIDDYVNRGVAKEKADNAFKPLREAVEAYRNRSLWFKIARYVAFAVVVTVATIGTGLIIIIKGKK